MRIVDELVGRLFEEMDYEREAKQCNRFRETYQDGKIAGRVRAPVVVDALSTSRVLTMEFGPRRTHRRVTKALRRRFVVGTRRKRRQEEEKKQNKVHERVSAARNPSTRRAVFFTPTVGDWFHARRSAPEI